MHLLGAEGDVKTNAQLEFKEPACAVSSRRQETKGSGVTVRIRVLVTLK